MPKATRSSASLLPRFDLPRDLSGLAGPLANPVRRAAEFVRDRALAGQG
ncbi:hypothetical protein [Devosia sp. 63-57]|nr:hypothetical protein [Devosia sp. 63-57]